MIGSNGDIRPLIEPDRGMTTTLDTPQEGGPALCAAVDRPHDRARTSSFAGDSPNLDLIRAVAVLCVYFGHFYTIFTASESIWAWRFAQMGVCIFFVYTCFVLMLSLERAQRRGESLFGDFYIRRLFRLMPLSIVCTLFVYFFVPPDGDAPGWTPWELFANLTLIQFLTFTRNMISVSWSLAFEWQMYLFLPFLFLFGRTRPFWMLMGLWVLALGLAMLQPMVSARAGILHFVPNFMAGVIAWKLSLMRPRSVPGWLWPIAFMLTWVIFLAAQHEQAMFFRSFFALALGLAIPWFGEMPSGVLGKAAHVVAKYSYGIYLSHPGLLWFAHEQTWPMAVKLGFVAVTSAAVPYAMFHLIESPMITAGMRVVSHSRKLWRSRSDAAW